MCYIVGYNEFLVFDWENFYVSLNLRCSCDTSIGILYICFITFCFVWIIKFNETFCFALTTTLASKFNRFSYTYRYSYLIFLWEGSKTGFTKEVCESTKALLRYKILFDSNSFWKEHKQGQRRVPPFKKIGRFFCIVSLVIYQVKIWNPRLASQNIIKLRVKYWPVLIYKIFFETIKIN